MQKCPNCQNCIPCGAGIVMASNGAQCCKMCIQTYEVQLKVAQNASQPQTTHPGNQ